MLTTRMRNIYAQPTAQPSPTSTSAITVLILSYSNSAAMALIADALSRKEETYLSISFLSLLT